MKLEGDIPTPYHGDRDYGRDWLERHYFPQLSRLGFIIALVACTILFNVAVILHSAVYFLLCAGAVIAALVFAPPLRGTEEKGFSVMNAAGMLALLAWAGWLAVDLDNTGVFHKHLVLTLTAVLVAVAWHDRRCRYAWWTVIPTSDAWNEQSLSAYAEFLVATKPGPYCNVIARELFRLAANLALKPGQPAQYQLDAIRRYVWVLREGIGGWPDFGEARWWKDKLNEFEERESNQRLLSRKGIF